MRLPLIALTFALTAAVSFSAPSRGLDLLVDILAKTDDAATQADVLTGIADALHGQRSAPMPAGWKSIYPKLKSSQDQRVRKLAVELALVFGDSGALATLREQATDAKVNAAARLSAIDALAGVHDEKLGPILLSLLDEPALRDTAIRDLAAYSETQTPSALQDRYAKFTPAEQRDALATLSSRAAWGSALLDAVGAGKVPRTDISALTIRQLMSLNDAGVNERVKKDYGAVRPHTGDKAALLDKYRKTFRPDFLAKADLSHGRLIFSKTCGACHTLFDAGGKLGPNLTGSQRANIDYLLEKISDPSATVPKENYTALIETNDGRTITGIVVAEANKSLTVRDATQDVTLARGDIKSRRSQPMSMMPEGLLEAMSPADARDLLAYLQSPVQVPMGVEKK